MELEDKKALLEALMKSAGNGKVELVMEKHVEAEIHHVEPGGVGIQKVEAGGIGIQNVYHGNANGKAGSNAGSKAGDKKAKKSATPKLTKATFSYRYLEKCRQRIMLLFQGLLKAELIDGDTKPDDFLALFEGKPSDVKIKWKGSLASLWYLFKVMLEKGYVVKPEGVGQWIVVQSHFVDAKSKMFADFNKQKPPLKLKEVLEVLAELLNPNFEHTDRTGFTDRSDNIYE